MSDEKESSKIAKLTVIDGQSGEDILAVKAGTPAETYEAQIKVFEERILRLRPDPPDALNLGNEGDDPLYFQVGKENSLLLPDPRGRFLKITGIRKLQAWMETNFGPHK